MSKNYSLIQHRVAYDTICEVLYSSNIELGVDINSEIKITEYGERIAISVFLPDKYSYSEYSAGTNKKTDFLISLTKVNFLLGILLVYVPIRASNSK